MGEIKLDHDTRLSRLVWIDSDGFAWTVMVCGYSMRTYESQSEALDLRDKLKAEIRDTMEKQP